MALDTDNLNVMLRQVRTLNYLETNWHLLWSTDHVALEFPCEAASLSSSFRTFRMLAAYVVVEDQTDVGVWSCRICGV